METGTSGRPLLSAPPSRLAALACSLVVIAVGVIVLIGWLLDIRALIHLVPHWNSMKADTALGFVLGGVALLALSAESAGGVPASWRIPVSRVCAAGMALVAAGALLEYATGQPAGLREWLFLHQDDALTKRVPDRMAVATAFNFFLLGNALLLAGPSRWRATIAQSLAAAAATFALTAIIATSYQGAGGVYASGFFAQGAPHTSWALVILAVGVLLAMPRGALSRLMSSGKNAKALRRLIAAAFVVPWALGYVAMKLANPEQLGATFSIPFLVSAFVIAAVAILLPVSAYIVHVEQELMATLRGIGEGIITTDIAGRVTDMNPVAERLTGWPAGVAGGRQLHEVLQVVDEATRNPVGCPVARVIDEDAIVGCAGRILLISRDGSEWSISSNCAPVHDDSGDVCGAVLVLHDKTEERRANMAAAESEERFAALFNAYGDGLLLFESAGIFDCNSVAAEMFALPGRGQLEGISLAALFPAHLPSGELFSEKLRAAETEGHAHFEWACRRVDTAEEFPAEVLITHVVFNGRPMYIAGVRNISDKMRVQARLLQLERMASMGVLAAGLAHEINNPLASVLSNIELAMSDAESSASGCGEPLRSAGALADAREAAERVRAIVRDLNVFSRGDAADGSESADINKAIARAARMASNEIRHKARLVINHGELPRVTGHEHQLEQVFINLLVNAAQSIPEGHAEENEIRITSRPGAPGQVVIDVADTGKGVPVDALPRLFEPFFTTKAAGPGTGLGLSICNRIVGDLGGHIEVQSETGKGTVFSVHLPVAKVSASPVAVPKAAPPEAGPRGRVLVIDDEVMLGNTIRRILGREHDVTTTTDARDALERIRKGEDFDLVLCDLMMPEMSGAAFYEMLAREAPALAGRVIFMSGGVFGAENERFIREAQKMLIEKPFNNADLRAIVNERLRKVPAVG